MALSVHTLAGHPGHHAREPGAHRPAGKDFAAMIHEQLGVEPGSGKDTRSPSSRGAGASKGIEPYLMSASDLALLASETPTGAEDGTEPHPTGRVLPGSKGDNRVEDTAQGTEPSPISEEDLALLTTPIPDPVEGIEPQIVEKPADSDFAASAMGTEPPDLDPPVVVTEPDPALTERALEAMREATMRFDSLSALLRLTQGI